MLEPTEFPKAADICEDAMSCQAARLQHELAAERAKLEQAERRIAKLEVGIREAAKLSRSGQRDRWERLLQGDE